MHERRGQRAKVAGRPARFGTTWLTANYRASGAAVSQVEQRLATRKCDVRQTTLLAVIGLGLASRARADVRQKTLFDADDKDDWPLLSF